MNELKRHMICCLMLLPLFAGAQGKLHTKLDTSSMLIGDHNHVRFELRDTLPLENIQIQYEYWDTLSNVELLRQQPLVHRQEKDSHYYTRIIRFTAFDSGQVILPSVPVSWDRKGTRENAQSPVFNISVTYPALDSPELAPIKPIEKEPLKWQDYSIYVYSILGLLILASLTYLWLRRTPTAKDEIPREAAIDPHERAFIRLQSLENRGLLEIGRHEEFQVILSSIIREFLSLKYNIPAMESTTSEIIRETEKTTFPGRKIKVLRELLSMADLVKFAKAEKAEDFHRRMLLEAKEIVKITNDLR